MSPGVLEEKFGKYPQIKLESPIQGFYFLQKFAEGIEEFKKIAIPTPSDENWVGMCYYMQDQTTEAVSHAQMAINRGNVAAGISLATIYLYSNRIDEGVAELEKIDFAVLSGFHQHLFLMIRAIYYYDQCSLQKAYADVEKAWSLGQTLPEWSFLILRNAFHLSNFHSDMGQVESALWFLEQGRRSYEGDLGRMKIMSIHILLKNGRFLEAKDYIESLCTNETPEAYLATFYLDTGRFYLAHHQLSEAEKSFQNCLKLISKQPNGTTRYEKCMAHINLATLHLSKGAILKAQEHLMNAKIEVKSDLDKKIYRSREISFQLSKKVITLQAAKESFEKLATEFATQGYIVEEGKVRLHIIDIKRQQGEDIQNDLDEIYCLGLAMQNSHFLAYEWILLPELFEIAKISHPILTQTQHTTAINTFQNIIELNFLNDRQVVINGEVKDFPLKWCEVLLLLAKYSNGLNSEELLAYLYGDGQNMSTLKPMLSKLRDHAPIASRPYRLEAKIKADFIELEQLLTKGQIKEALALYQGGLLPTSQAPKIVELREQLEETLRQSVLQSDNTDLYFEVAKRLGDDLEVWESLLSYLPLNDPKYPYVASKVKKIKQDWQKPN